LSVNEPRQRRRARHIWPWVVALWPCFALAASGSWSGTGDGPRVAGPDRSYVSAIFHPPAIAVRARVRRVHWGYALPPDRRLIAELCMARHCVLLGGDRGTSDAFAGTSAATPSVFRFRLPPGERRAVRVGAIRLMVDYQ